MFGHCIGNGVLIQNLFLVSTKMTEQTLKLLKQEGLTKAADTRLNSVLQLAGLTTRDILKFILNEVLDINDVHMRILSPTNDILDA